MVEKKSLNQKTKRQVLNYLSLLKEKGVFVEKAIVFGSQAKGKSKVWSDIDICLVSKKFKVDTFNQTVKLALIAHKASLDIEPHLYHPAGLREKYDPLASEIRKYGIEVK